MMSGCSHTCNQLTSDRYQCGCPDGLSLNDDQDTCININECDEGIYRCEHVCTDTVGSYVCSCRRGYTVINVVHCEDIDECLEHNDCQDTCTNTVGSYTCTIEQEKNMTSM